eukprot:3670983-Lingulodinium_polyedra.AAC.1
MQGFFIGSVELDAGVLGLPTPEIGWAPCPTHLGGTLGPHPRGRSHWAPRRLGRALGAIQFRGA